MRELIAVFSKVHTRGISAVVNK